MNSLHSFRTDPGETAWHPRYESIDGFTWEPGRRYRIRVAVRRIANPPMDGSDIEYHLVGVLSREQVFQMPIP